MANLMDRLEAKLRQAGVRFDGVGRDYIHYAPGESEEKRVIGDAILADFDPAAEQAAADAEEAAEQQSEITSKKDLLDNLQLALDRLQQIDTNRDSLNTAQQRTAIGDLAKILRRSLIVLSKIIQKG